MSGTKYAKYNKVHFRSSADRENGIKQFNEFFKTLGKDNEQKIQGHVILESLGDPKEAIVLTFWETQDDMDKFYSARGGPLENLVERVKPLFEKMPERTDYALSDLDIPQ